VHMSRRESNINNSCLRSLVWLSKSSEIAGQNGINTELRIWRLQHSISVEDVLISESFTFSSKSASRLVKTVTTRGVMVTSRSRRQEKRNTVVLHSFWGSISRLDDGGRV
jgi:hypothetical protein